MTTRSRLQFDQMDEDCTLAIGSQGIGPARPCLQVAEIGKTHDGCVSMPYAHVGAEELDRRDRLIKPQIGGDTSEALAITECFPVQRVIAAFGKW